MYAFSTNSNRYCCWPVVAPLWSVSTVRRWFEWLERPAKTHSNCQSRCTAVAVARWSWLNYLSQTLSHEWFDHHFSAYHRTIVVWCRLVVCDRQRYCPQSLITCIQHSANLYATAKISTINTINKKITWLSPVHNEILFWRCEFVKNNRKKCVKFTSHNNSFIINDINAGVDLTENK